MSFFFFISQALFAHLRLLFFFFIATGTRICFYDKEIKMTGSNFHWGIKIKRISLLSGISQGSVKTTGPSRNESESTTLMDEQNQEGIKNSSTPFPVSSSTPNLLTSLCICNNLYE